MNEDLDPNELDALDGGDADYREAQDRAREASRKALRPASAPNQMQLLEV